jgi:predicted S18 family serine protease
MPRVRTIVRPVAATLLGAILLAGCAEPPTREISQAQGALDAARAAGADTYAQAEFQAAETALKKSHDAVAERDYRQALSFALDARERARTAAREGSAARARAATEVAQAIQSVALGVQAARTRLAGAAGTRELRARLGPALDELTAQLQEARSAFAAGDYARAAERTKAIEERLATITADVPRR